MSSQSLPLTDVLRRDQRERWQRGERVLVESYLEHHPALSSDAAALLDLIESEIALREELGEVPQAEEYIARFASLRTPLSALLSRRLPTAAAGAKTDRGDGVATKAIKCPFCTTDLRGPLVDLQGQCDHCGRELKFVDETVSLAFKAGRMIGSFELKRRVGRGTFGEVWLARDSVLQRDVAIKVPRGVEQDRKAVDRFLREARAAAKLKHPNLVSVYETGDVDGVPYIATAYIEGTNLQDLIDRRKLTLEQLARMLQTIAAAVAHAHAAGILHRDLKPANVLVDTSGAPHVGDFGLAKNLFSADATLTIDGQIVGTPAYMAPEQTRAGGHPITAASDVYALGVMLYELMTHRRPFTGELESIFHQIRSEEPVPPRKIDPAIPHDLETICLKAMSKRPEERYASAQDLADDLGRYLKGELIQGKRPSLVRRMTRRLRAVSPALVVVALACGLAGVGLGLSRRDNPPQAKQVPEAPAPAPIPDPIIVGEPKPPSDDFRYDVYISEPAGANIVVYQLDFDTFRPQFSTKRELGVTPLTAELSSGQYLVVAYNDKGEFHEVIRSVPQRAVERWGHYFHETWDWKPGSSTIEWKPFQLFPATLDDEELVWSDGAKNIPIDMTAAGGDLERWDIPRFGLQTTEVTAHRVKGFYQKFNSAHPANYPAVKLCWDEAMAWAESKGMRLPDLVEAEFLATVARRPGDDPKRMNTSWNRPVMDARADVLDTQPLLFGLSSGALEWTQTRSQVKKRLDREDKKNNQWLGQRYIVRGGSVAALNEPILDQDGRWASVNQHLHAEGVGLRCARSPGPRRNADDFLQLVP
jgi:serine/threonine protein kinase